MIIERVRIRIRRGHAEPPRTKLTKVSPRYECVITVASVLLFVAVGVSPSPARKFDDYFSSPTVSPALVASGSTRS